MYNLWLAFDGTAQPIPGAGRRAASGTWRRGFQTAVDAAQGGRVQRHRERRRRCPTTPAASPTRRLPRRRAPRPTSGRRHSTRSAWPRASPTWRVLQLPARRRAAPRGLAVGAVLGRPDAEGLAAGLPAGDRRGDRRLRRRATRSRAAGRAATSCRRARRPGSSAPPRPSPLRVDLSWSAAADDTGVATYRVYRNGAHVGTTTATSWTNVSVAPGTTYTYVVRALDAARQHRRRLGARPGDDARHRSAVGARPAGRPGPRRPGPDRPDVARRDRQRRGHVVRGQPRRRRARHRDRDVVQRPRRRKRPDVHVRRRRAGRCGEPRPCLRTRHGDVARLGAAGRARVARRRRRERPRPRRSLLGASADDVGVAGYEVLRGGVVLATVATTVVQRHDRSSRRPLRLRRSRLRRGGQPQRRDHRGGDRAGQRRAVRAHERGRQGLLGADASAGVVEGGHRQRRRHRVPRLPERRPARLDLVARLRRLRRRQEDDVQVRSPRRGRGGQPRPVLGNGLGQAG